MRGVKKVQKVKFKKILLRALKDIGLKADDKILEDYWLYMNFLLQENKKYNLTGIKEEKEVITRHFFDSLTPLPYLDINKDDKILINNLMNVYSLEYIKSVQVIQLQNKSFIISKDDIPKLSNDAKEVFLSLASNEELQNPVYINVSNKGRVLVD